MVTRSTSLGGGRGEGSQQHFSTKKKDIGCCSYQTSSPLCNWLCPFMAYSNFKQKQLPSLIGSRPSHQDVCSSSMEHAHP